MAIPDINVAVKACGGKLGLIGLIRFMLARRRIDLIRGVVGGVLKPFRNRGIEAALGYRTLKTLQQSGFKHIEFSWMLESNQRIHRVLDNLNIPVTKRWRVYGEPTLGLDRNCRRIIPSAQPVRCIHPERAGRRWCQRG